MPRRLIDGIVAAGCLINDDSPRYVAEVTCRIGVPYPKGRLLLHLTEVAAMRRPRLVDPFCGAGGASRGYQLAGFHVTGIDIEPQPHYIGDEFIQADATELLSDAAFMATFDAAGGSPPCQGYSKMTRCRPGLAAEYPKLIEVVRDLYRAWGGPWIIENVEGAGLPGQDDLFGAYGVMLCSCMFGRELYRARWFEASFPLPRRRLTRGTTSPRARQGTGSPAPSSP